MIEISKTDERIIPDLCNTKEEYLLYLRHLFAYEFAKKEIHKNSLILEIGCGEGYGTNLLSQYAKKIIGLDIYSDVIVYASKKYGSEKCLFRLYNGKEIPYGNDTFDIVISFQVIEHILDDLFYVSEVYRVLKQGGIFILTTPNRIIRLKNGQKPWNKFHVREYYHYELENLLRCYFSDVKVLGIRGKDEINKIEIERVKQDLNIVYLFPENIRKLVPESLKPKIINILRKIIHRNKKDENNENFVDKYTLQDYYVIQDHVCKDSLDLLGICKK